jgi:hypothetical protein
MKYFFLILSIPFILHAQEQVHYQSKGLIELDNSKLIIKFNYKTNNLTQEHITLKTFDSPRFKWASFFDYTFGNEMDPFHERFLDKIASDIYAHAVKNKYTNEQLFSLLISFTNSLSSIKSGFQRDWNFYYYPYEIFMIGAQSDIDKMSVFSALASSFCYDLTFGVFDGKFAASVLVTHDGDITYSDNDYKSLQQALGSEIIQVFGFSERCKYQSLRSNPIDPSYVIPFNSGESVASFDSFERYRSEDSEHITLSLSTKRHRLNQSSPATTIPNGYVVFSSKGTLQATPHF